MENAPIGTADDSSAAAEETPSIGGVCELAIGLTAEDESALIQYWEQFGFDPGESGTLSAAQASRLYGVESGLRSIRLHHQDTDKGLLRLMVWEEPVNEGLGLSPLKVVGSRWGAMLSLDALNIANHAEDAIAAGLPVYYVPPQRNFINPPDPFQPFVQANPCIHEMVLIQPLTRQVIVQRHDYTRPFFGIINPESHFKASEFIHVGLVVTCSREQLNFYEQVLGLVDGANNAESQYGEATRRILELKGPEKGERMFNAYFTAPVSSPTNPPQLYSGNLTVLRFEGTLPNKLSHSRPGSLGVCLYTFRVRGIESYHQRVTASAATEVTQVCENEFGERSFSFVAPDGYFWTLLE